MFFALGNAGGMDGAGGAGDPKCFLGRREPNIAPFEWVSMSPMRYTYKGTTCSAIGILLMGKIHAHLSSNKAVGT